MKRSAAEQFQLTVKEWGLILAAAVLLHVILFGLFRPVENELPGQNMDQQFTLYLSENNLQSKSDAWKINYWVKFMNPEDLLKPDVNTGFSVVRQHQEKELPAPETFKHDLFDPASQYHKTTPVQSVDIRGLDYFISGYEQPVVEHPRPIVLSPRESIYPVWTDEKGIKSYGFSLNDKDADKKMKSLQEVSLKQTILKLTLAPGKIPQVDLLQSCGNLQLDHLARRQLTARQANYGISSYTEKYFLVDWQPPSIHHCRKEQK